MENISLGTLNRSVEARGTIENDESELVLRLKQILEVLGVEAGVTQVQEVVNRLEGLEVNRDLLFLPSSVMMVPTNTTRPLGGVLLKSFNFCWAEVIADRTDKRFTRDLIFAAVPISSASILLTCTTESFGGMIKEIIEVPEPLAASRDLINFLILHCSIETSLSSIIGADIVQRVTTRIACIEAESELTREVSYMANQNST